VTDFDCLPETSGTTWFRKILLELR